MSLVVVLPLEPVTAIFGIWNLAAYSRAKSNKAPLVSFTGMYTLTGMLCSFIHCSSTTAAYPPCLKDSFANVCPSNFSPLRAQKIWPFFKLRESVQRRTDLEGLCLP